VLPPIRLTKVFLRYGSVEILSTSVGTSTVAGRSRGWSVRRRVLSADSGLIWRSNKTLVLIISSISSMSFLSGRGGLSRLGLSHFKWKQLLASLARWTCFSPSLRLTLSVEYFAGRTDCPTRGTIPLTKRFDFTSSIPFFAAQTTNRMRACTKNILRPILPIDIEIADISGRSIPSILIDRKSGILL